MNKENLKAFAKGGVIGLMRKKKQEKEKAQGKKPTKQKAEKKSAPATGKTPGLAIACLVLGILSVFLGWIPIFGWTLIILTIVFGRISYKRIKNENLPGRGMVIAGAIMGGVGLVFVILTGFAFISSTGGGKCKSAACFMAGADQCLSLKYEETTDVGTIKYTSTFNDELHKCVFTKEIAELKDNEDPVIKAAIEGKSMRCTYAKNQFNGEWVTTTIEGLEDCDGDLKEAIGQLLLII